MVSTGTVGKCLCNHGHKTRKNKLILRLEKILISFNPAYRNALFSNLSFANGSAVIASKPMVKASRRIYSLLPSTFKNLLKGFKNNTISNIKKHVDEKRLMKPVENVSEESSSLLAKRKKPVSIP
jgi:hypothetical protein